MALEIRRLPTPADLRWFGLIMAAVFGVLGGVLWWQLEAVAVARVLWALGLGLMLLYYLIPPLRLPLYLGWMHGVAPIGWLVTHLVLGIIFYGLITPMGLIMRLFRRDRLQRKRDPSKESYWQDHDPGGDTARYFRQT